MSGPSIDAIRKFKEKLAKEKELEIQRANETKLSTLEHRAAQGDRKAKKVLKDLEIKAENARIAQAKSKEAAAARAAAKNQFDNRNRISHTTTAIPSQQKTPTIKKDLSFSELMELAKKNKGERPQKVKDPLIEAPKLPSETAKPKQPSIRPAKLKESSTKPKEQPLQLKEQPPRPKEHPSRPREHPPQSREQPLRPKEQPRPRERQIAIPRDQTLRKPTMPARTPQPPLRIPEAGRSRPFQTPAGPGGTRRRPMDHDDDDDEDEFDDFIDDGEDEDAQMELSKTLRSIFGYDKRKYAIREAMLDAEAERNYRAIGKVQTYEDLEREEKRSARIAAQEDRQARQEEEDRRAMKKLRKAQG